VTISALVVLLISITGLAPNEVIQARAINTALAACLRWRLMRLGHRGSANRAPALFGACWRAYRKSFGAICAALLSRRWNPAASGTNPGRRGERRVQIWRLRWSDWRPSQV
jgi:hypothetical protein